MADDIKQSGRLLSLATPAGQDVLCIERAAIVERMSRPFSMQFDLVTEASKKSQIKPDQLLGKPVTLTVELPENKKRYFNGIVSRFSAGETDNRVTRARMEVVPWLWLLTLSSDCKVFQNLTVPEIIEKVFKEWQGNFPDAVNFENKTSGSFTKLDYCVQYRESDFNFISRLMEEEGIFYFFKHEDGKHTLVMGNSASAYQACPNQAKARYSPEAGMGEWEDLVHSWEHTQSIVPGKYDLGDHHFQLPNNKKLKPSADSKVNVGNNDKLEIFDYPGEYAERFNKPDERLNDVEKHGGDMVKWRIEEQSAAHLRISGTSSCRPFSTGTYFELTGKDGAQIKVPGTQGKYVLASVKHNYDQSPDYATGNGVPHPYRNSFTCIPQEVAFRPSRSTPKPVIQGVQTALVVGLDGEEIDCDKYGRVKVQFHWDRQGKCDENSSCWIRVGTPLAGKQWGMIHIPRIGQEVIVAFLEGDPDQPLIVGSVYDYDNTPPYKLPDNKTQSGIKTRSTKKGDQDTFNELRFEDQKGKEHIYMHAQRNMVRIVENFDLTKVGNPDIPVTPKAGTQGIAVRETQQFVVGIKDQDGNNPAYGNQLFRIWNNQKLKIGDGGAEASEGSQIVEIYKDRTVTLDQGNDSLQMKMGNQTTKLDLGKSETEAMQSIEFKVGQSSIKIDQTGVTISGMMIKINGQAMTQIQGTMTQVQGSAMLQLSGGIMMLG